MATSQYSLKPLALSEPSKQDTQQLINLQRSLGDMTADFVNKDIQTIESETSKIEGFANGIKNVISKLTGYKQECTKTISDLQAEVDDLNGKIKVYERDFKNNNKENEYRKQIETNQKKYLAEWEKRIQIASKIDTDALLKVQIEDRKSKANDVFKWIIVGIYGEPDTKFYWPNFKQQIFEKDEGKDFRERMGKINASNAREEQRVKTEDFLKAYKEIAASKQLKKVTTQIQEIKKVAQIYLTCYEISKTIKNLESLIEKSRQQSRQRDEEAMRWKARAQALQDRIISNKEYLAILNKIESQLGGKVQNYVQKQETAREIVQKLKESGTISHLDINLEDDKRDNCECTIF